MLQKFAKKFILFIMYILLEYFVFQKTKKKNVIVLLCIYLYCPCLPIIVILYYFI